MVSLPDNDSAACELNDVLQWFDADRGEFVWLEQLIAQHPAAFFASNRFKPGGVHPDAETTFSMVDLPETAALPEAHAAHLLDDVFTRAMPIASPSFMKVLTALNQNVVKLETSAAMTALERQVIGMLHKLVFGQDDAFYRRWLHSGDHALGGFCSGGTVANLTALWGAATTYCVPGPALPGSTASGSCRRCVIMATMGSLSSYRSAGTIRCARPQMCLGSIAIT